MLNSTTVRQRVHSAGARAARIVGWHGALTAKEAILVSDIAAAKGRMSLTDEMSAVFEALQTMAHERSVGSLEALLTAILEDVLPGEGVAKLITGYKANNPHLDILLAKGENLEDILEGNGGAMANTISIALRYAALVRTNNRRVMVLDEADCWVKPSRVPALASTIAQVSAQGQIQTMFITHHELDLLNGAFNVVELVKNEADKVEARVLHRAAPDWADNETPGIRELTLINVRRHEHTVLPWLPGATALIGDNNLGKSAAVVSALRALAYGESDDTLIRHECEEARVLAKIEKGITLEMSRHLKRNPTVLFRMYDETGKLVREDRAPGRGQAPEWVEDLLGIKLVDGIDIQLRNQKQPVFLLDESPAKRAQILSMGRESGHLRSLMKAYEEVKATDRDTIRRGEAELNQVRVQLVFLQPGQDVADKAGKLADTAEPLLEQLGAIERLSSTLTKVQQLSSEVMQLSCEAETLALLPAVPELKDCKALETTLVQLTAGARVEHVRIESLPGLPAVPVLQDVTEVARLGRQLATLAPAMATAQQAFDQLPAVPSTLPELVDLTSLVSKATALGDLVRLATAEAQELATCQAEAAEAEANLATLKESLGGVCPLCDTPFTKGHSHAHAVH